MSTRLLVGGAVSVILLLLYVFLVVYALLAVLGLGGLTPAAFTAEMASTMGTIGGLISALVIAELALTKPGEAPTARVFTAAWVGPDMAGGGAGNGGAAAAGGSPGAAAAGGSAGAAAAGADAATRQARRAAMAVTYLYLSVWLITGLAAFFFGNLLHASALPALTDVGRGWLGLAVAAGYAYLGLQAPQPGA